MYRNQTPVYLVKDDHGEILEGTFYAEEIQKAVEGLWISEPLY
jgi:hypothetical protein